MPRRNSRNHILDQTPALRFALGLTPSPCSRSGSRHVLRSPYESISLLLWLPNLPRNAVILLKSAHVQLENQPTTTENPTVYTVGEVSGSPFAFQWYVACTEADRRRTSISQSEGFEWLRCSDPGVPQKCLAPESRVVLQQVVDVPDPVVFLARTDTFRFPILYVVTDGRPINAWDWEPRRLDLDRFSWVQNSRGLAIHGNTGRGSAPIPNL